MDISKFDKLYGKHFNFPNFENDHLLIQSAGYGIGVNFKGDHSGGIIHTWILYYPLFNNYNIPSKSDCGWKLNIKSSDTNEIKIIFEEGGKKYTLTITCTNESLKLKPIKIKWN